MPTDYQEYRPRKWADFISNNPKIEYVKNRVALGDWEEAGPFLIQGPNGSGKTSLAHLMARSSLCPNRADGTWENCGACDVCLGAPHPAIIDYTVEDATEVKEAFKEIMAKLEARPLFAETRRNRVRWWVIVNEFQSVSRERASSLLNQLENYKAHATWILVTMEPERLPVQVREAIEGRCKRITLTEPSDAEVAKALMRHPKVTPECAKAVTGYVKGNYRKAWSELGPLLADRGTLTVDDVHQWFAGGADPRSRQKLWVAIEQGQHRTAIDIRAQWGIDDDTLYGLLLGDLVRSPNPDPEVFRAMGLWKATPKKPDLVMGCLLQFLNRPMPQPALAMALCAKTFEELVRL